MYSHKLNGTKCGICVSLNMQRLKVVYHLGNMYICVLGLEFYA